MSYSQIERRLKDGGIVILDGGTGTELERRGVPMDAQAWCGPATLEHLDVLEAIHGDYIAAGADVITANTYASSKLMLTPAGFADRFEDINRAAVETAHRAREKSGKKGLAVAGSLSHMVPMLGGTSRPDQARAPSQDELAEAFGELAALLRDAGCDLIILEMMYHPDRMAAAFAAATGSSLPVWAGFAARRGENGQALSFTPENDIPFAQTVRILEDFEVAAAGVMHTPANVVGDAVAIVGDVFKGPRLAYPDSGYFEMPNWQFKDVIAPAEFLSFATQWVADGVQVVGGCCGLTPDHIAALAPLRDGAPH